MTRSIDTYAYWVRVVSLFILLHHKVEREYQRDKSAKSAVVELSCDIEIVENNASNKRKPDSIDSLGGLESILFLHQTIKEFVVDLFFWRDNFSRHWFDYLRLDWILILSDKCLVWILSWDRFGQWIGAC